MANAKIILDPAAVAQATWRKSSRSGPFTDNCVEVAPINGIIAVRDTKDPDGPVQAYSTDEWNAFLDAAKAGEFDQLA